MNRHAILILLSVACSCAYAETPAPLKAGVILPLTGDGSFWGMHARNSMLLAQGDINAAGGVRGRRLELIIEDGRCDAKTAVSAYHKLVEIDRVTVVLGEICSSATLAVAELAQRNKIVLITPCSESPDISRAGDFIFRTWTPNNAQARVMARYVRENLAFSRAAVLAVNNGFGKPLADAFREEFGKAGGTTAAFETYDQGASDFRAQLLRIRQAHPQVLFLVSYQPDGLAALRQIAALRLTPRIATTSAMNSPAEVFKPLGPLAEGLILADLPDLTTAEFRSRYAARFGGEWPGVSSCAGVAYDDVQILARAFAAAGTDSTAVRGFLAGLRDYRGVSGVLSFDANGDLEREHEVFMVEQGALRAAGAPGRAEPDRRLPSVR